MRGMIPAGCRLGFANFSRERGRCDKVTTVREQLALVRSLRDIPQQGKSMRHASLIRPTLFNCAPEIVLRRRIGSHLPIDNAGRVFSVGRWAIRGPMDGEGRGNDSDPCGDLRSADPWLAMGALY